MGDNKTTGSEPLSDEALEDVSGGNWFTDIFTATPKPNPREARSSAKQRRFSARTGSSRFRTDCHPGRAPPGRRGAGTAC